MRAVVQRVTEARVLVDGAVVGEIGPGLCVLVGVTHDDDDVTARRLAEKLWQLRIFNDAAGVMNVSAADQHRPVLVISQFTLYGDTRKGRRPSWAAAAPSDHAERLVGALVTTLRDLGAEVSTGRFGAEMQVDLVNDGPVTLILDA